MASELNARAPSVPGSLLTIATVMQTWRADTRQVINDGVRVVPFPDQLPKIDGLSLVLQDGVWKVSGAWIAGQLPKAEVYAIGEFKDWFEQTPPPGWAVRNGAVLPSADKDYPDLWAYLQKSENLWKCKTLAQWNALSSAAGGVGGVPFFVVNTTAKTIKLPDTRGDYTRCAGSSL